MHILKLGKMTEDYPTGIKCSRQEFVSGSIFRNIVLVQDLGAFL